MAAPKTSSVPSILAALTWVWGLAAGLAGAPAAAAAEADGWAWRVTPYLFIPGLDAGLAAEAPPPGGGRPDASLGPVEVLPLINMVAMVNAEARRGRAFVFVDWMYLDLGDVDARLRAVEFPDGTVPIGAGVELASDASLDAFALLLGGGARAWSGDAASLDLYGGLRTFDLSTTLRWTLTASVSSPDGSASFPAAGMRESQVATWDAVLGARGEATLAPTVRAFALADLGRGEGSDSRQWAIGVAHRGATVEVGLAWRDARFGWDEANGGSWLRLAGPLLSVSFGF